ncbi:MAG: PAS domain S-box protein [Bacteroidetes bacterium]|nr:PAS domain S-box protein [Bacteroidota bacterium]
MVIQKKELEFLVVEDNPGDFMLIRDYLTESIGRVGIQQATTCKEARQFLGSAKFYDAVILDLTLPDSSGLDLVQEIMKYRGKSLVIVLTGFSDKDFGIKALSLGVDDYLLKDELTSSQLYKSIAYSLERQKSSLELKRSEEKYKSLFQISPIPAWIFDEATYRFLDINHAAIEHYGYTKEEINSMTVFDLWPASDHNRLLKAFEKNADAKTLFKEISRHVTKNGDLIHTEIQSNEIEYGSVKARLLLAIDITDKLRAEESLKLSEQRFKALVQDGSDLISILDMNGNYIYVSPTSKTVLGHSAEDFSGKNVFDFIHPEDRSRVMRQFSLLELKRRVYISPFRFRDRDDNWRWIETFVTNLTRDPAVRGVVANSKDISQHVRFEKILKESNERYEAVARATSDAIWDYNIAAEKLYLLGTGYKNMFGYDLANQYTDHKQQESLLHPEDRIRVMDTFRVAVSKPNEKQHAVEYRFLRENGDYAYVLNRFSVVYEGETPVRLLGAIQDITRQKEEEHRLKLLESVVTNTTDAILITEAEPIDAPGPRIVYVNPAFTKMTGYQPEDVIGKTPRLLQGEKTSRKDLDAMRQALNRWESFEIELINYRKDGEEFWVNMAITPIADSKGWFTHWISVQRDITERKKLEQEKENLITELTHTNENLRQFSYITSHNLRGPIANLLGLTNLIDEKQIADESLRMIMKGIKKATNMFDETIKDLIKVLVIKDNLSIQKEELDLDQVLSKILAQVSLMVEEAGVVIDSNFDEAPVVSFNKAYLESIFLNLLTNAMKYKSPLRKLEVKIRSYDEGDSVVLTVQDNGIGMNLALYREKVFGLYQKFHDHPDSKGLGLFLVKSQMEALGGKIEVESQVNVGTTFILRFKKEKN